ncbi:DNA-repair protein XRCC4, putative [Ricinus communis]|uniref:DNA-repair protein XRCC4, putative n=1 Tax=Ricinus communis TaxID=3988 RepID=B9RTD9_RICCO|nr:DNA-repair protein XRCC4, putative [Ricinus communis]|eukprot:XP_002517008.1 DNA repair protein XRCC4 isoform X1 [Ricinus communis]
METSKITTEAETARHTCLKLEITEPIFVKGTWFDSHFHLSITDGLNAWVCNATEGQVKERAAQWDQPVSEYINLAEHYLGFQQPGSIYRFADAGDSHKRLSWTFEKEGTKLEWRWKCQPSPDNKMTTAGILDFLMDANIRLSEEVVKKTHSFERLKEEADKCLTQSERFAGEKTEFESSIYAKFLAVLNSKKRKLRQLRDQLSKKEASGKLPQEEEEESTDKTESFEEDSSDGDKSEEEPPEKVTGTSEDKPSSRGRGRKRITRK